MFEKAIHGIIILLVLLELIRIKYIYISLLLNYFIIFFLIFNNYYFFTLLFASILLLARFNLLLTDFYLSYFIFNIKVLDNLQDDEYIVPTWKNGVILSLWIMRGFPDYDDLKKDFDSYPNNWKLYFDWPNSNKYIVGFFGRMTRNFHRKYVQIPPISKQKMIFYRQTLHFKYELRNLEKEKIEERILEIKKKNNRHTWLYNGGLVTGVTKVTKFPHVDPKNKKEKVKCIQEYIESNTSVKIGKINNKLPLENTKKNKWIKEINENLHYDRKRDTHYSVYEISKNAKIMTKGHFSTLHEYKFSENLSPKSSALLGINYLGNDRKDGIVTRGPTIKIAEQTLDELIDEITENSGNYVIVNLPHDRIILGIDKDMEINKNQLPKEQYTLLDLIESNQKDVILPSELYQACTIFMSKTNTIEQVLISFDLAEKGMEKFIIDKNYPQKPRAALEEITAQIQKTRDEFIQNVTITAYSNIPNIQTQKFLDNLEKCVKYQDNSKDPQTTKWYKVNISPDKPEEITRKIAEKKVSSLSNVTQLKREEGGLKKEEIQDILKGQNAAKPPIEDIFPPTQL